MTKQIITPSVTVYLDETEAMPRLVVSFPKGTKLPGAFVQSCHDTAGEHGATIEWVERARGAE